MRGSFPQDSQGDPHGKGKSENCTSVWEDVPGGAQAVCIVGHSKNTTMQDLMTPQGWGPYSGCGCPGHHVRMPVLYVGNG